MSTKPFWATWFDDFSGFQRSGFARLCGAAFISALASNSLCKFLKWRLVLRLLLVLLLITLAPGMAQNPHDPFTRAKTLTYDVMWTVFRAGTVTSTLRTAAKEARCIRGHRHGAVGGLCLSPL
jgi:hypothetical protein